MPIVIRGRGSSGIFEEIKNVTPAGAEYWRARDLQEHLGYATWENFEEAIVRAREACDGSGLQSSHQFRETTKMMAVGKGGKRQVRDYFLSRYACYLVAMNSQPSKAKVAAAQSYFAVQTRRQELADGMTDDERRLVVRDRVRESNTELNRTASRAGVKNYAFFHDAGYRGMYTMSRDSVKKVKGIEPKEDLLDCVGRLELAANEFRITLTEERIRKESVKGQNAAENMHLKVGKKVRMTVYDEIGQYPESLPRAESIKKIAAKQKKKELKK